MSLLRRLNFSLIPIFLSFFFILIPTGLKLRIAVWAQSFFFFPAKFVKREVDYLRDLRRERDDLEKELISLNRQVALMRDSLRKDLEGEMNSLLRAEIVGRDHTLRCFLIIDKGRRDGVIEDQTALVAEGLVGKVLKVGESFSLIETFYSPYLNIAGVNQRTNEVGVVRLKRRGLKESFLALDYFSPNADILVGDTILTSGQGGIFPKGIKIGYVKNVFPTRDIFLDIIIEPVVNVLRIDGLYLLIQKDKGERVNERQEMEKLLKELELKIPELFKMR